MKENSIYNIIEDNEEIVWSGKPMLSIFSKRKTSTILTWVLLVLFVGIIIFFLFPMFFSLYFIVVGPITIGLLLIFNYIMNILIENNMCEKYYITNNRIIILKHNSIQLSRLESINGINIVYRPHTLTIVFGDKRMNFYGRYNALTFYNLSNNMYEELEEVFRKLKLK